VKTANESDRLTSIADIQRAAWFARLAFGEPSACIENVPVQPKAPSDPLLGSLV
jgi:hypothetical protein